MFKSIVLTAALLLSCSSGFGAASPGSLDTNFATVAGTDTFGNSLAFTPSGQLYVSGNYTNTRI